MWRKQELNNGKQEQSYQSNFLCVAGSITILTSLHRLSLNPKQTLYLKAIILILLLETLKKTPKKQTMAAIACF